MKDKKVKKKKRGTKYLTAFLAALTAFVLMVPVIQAQTVERSSWYAGFLGSVEKGAPTYGSTAMGISFTLGSGLYSITEMSGGEGGSAGSTSIAKLFHLGGRVKGGFIARAGVEFKPGGLPVNYADGAGGGLLVVDLDDKNEKYVCLAVKRQSDFQGDNLFEARWDIAAVFGWRFGG